MPTTTPYGLYYPDEAGDLLPFADYETLAKLVNNSLRGLGDFLAAGGGFLSDLDFNASVIAGQFALSVNGPNNKSGAFIGATGSLVYVETAGPFVLANGDGSITTGSIAVSTTNYFFINQSGQWRVSTSATVNAGEEIAFSAVFSTTEATSRNNAPAGRTNFLPLQSIAAEIVAARGSLGSLAARLTVVLNDDGTLKGFTLANSADIALGTGAGTKIGTAVSQKLGLWNTTPVVQPAAAGQAVVTLGNADNEIGGLTFSDPPTQAECQALRDKCEELADDVRNLSVLLHAMRTAAVALGSMKGST